MLNKILNLIVKIILKAFDVAIDIIFVYPVGGIIYLWEQIDKLLGIED